MKRLYTKQDKIEKFKTHILDNMSYKIVALFIALILWLSILNRRDFIVIKDLDVDFITSENLMVTAQSIALLKVKVSGPQPLLKRYKESSQVLALDLSDKNAGFYDIEVGPSKLDIPSGIKVLGIRPNTIRVEIIEKNKVRK